MKIDTGVISCFNFKYVNVMNTDRIVSVYHLFRYNERTGENPNHVYVSGNIKKSLTIPNG